MARNPRKSPEAPLPADQTIPPVDTSSPDEGGEATQPEPKSLPDPGKDLKIEHF